MVPNFDPAWGSIEEDLQFAIDNLPASRSSAEPGRVHKYTAEAVMAHAHMYQNEFSQAKTLFGYRNAYTACFFGMQKG